MMQEKKHGKEALHQAVGNLRKSLRDRTAKHKLFTLTVEHHEPPEHEKPPEHAGDVLLGGEDDDE
jgi:hypothetical protein